MKQMRRKIDERALSNWSFIFSFQLNLIFYFGKEERKE
jgi:hypothetical protein